MIGFKKNSLRKISPLSINVFSLACASQCEAVCTIFSSTIKMPSIAVALARIQLGIGKQCRLLPLPPPMHLVELISDSFYVKFLCMQSAPMLATKKEGKEVRNQFLVLLSHSFKLCFKHTALDQLLIVLSGARYSILVSVMIHIMVQTAHSVCI